MSYNKKISFNEGYSTVKMKRGSSSMSKMNISLIQLLCLIVLFELGSAILIGVGIEAKQDAWLAIMIAMIFGVVLFIMYSYLYILYPTEPLTLFVNKIVGQYAGNT